MAGIAKKEITNERLEIFTASGTWVFCSIGMMVFNKLAIEAFPLSCILVGAQMAFTVVAIVIFAFRSLHIGSIYDMLRWSLVAPFFAGVLLSSMFALHDAPMSLTITFRGLAPIFSLMAEVFYPTPFKVNSWTILCLFGILVGIAFYCKDLEASQFSAIGWVLLNNFFVVGDRLLQRLMLGKDQWPVDISKSACTLLNNSFGLVPLLIAAYFTMEFSKIPSALSGLDAQGYIWIFLTGVVGTGIAYAGIWTQSLINATSFLVLATANKFIVILIEVFVMQERAITPVQVLGASITITAGVAYGKVREAIEQAEKAQQAANNMIHEASPLVCKSA